MNVAARMRGTTRYWMGLTPIVVIASVVSATVTTSKRVPVKRPLRSSASRCPTSQSASWSYRATWTLRALDIDNILS